MHGQQNVKTKYNFDFERGALE